MTLPVPVATRTVVGTSRAAAPPLSPLWWLERLHKQLVDRQPDLELSDAYYRGVHRLPWLAPQAVEAFRRILQMARSNYMGLVVDATTERLEVLGFRVGDSPEGDKEAWRIWQANNLDAGSGEAFLEAVKCCCSYFLIAPAGIDPKTPRVTVEHPAQVIVEYEPGDNRQRAAGLKVWTDDRVGTAMATLYLPNWIYKYQGRPQNGMLAWEPRWQPRFVAGETWPARNPLGVVPLVEMRNNPQHKLADGRLSYAGVSEIADVIDIQDRINKTLADRLMTQDFGAFPQKWATGWEAEEDEQGNPLPHAVNIGRDRLVVAETKDVAFGQFAAAALDPYSNAKTEDVKDIASRTRTPSQYLLGGMVNISGEALQAAESGLVSKVKQRQRPFAEALEEVVRLFLLAAGDDRGLQQDTETIWRDPEYRSEAVRTDAVIKRRQAGLIPLRQAREDAGYSQKQIARMEEEDRREALRASLDRALNPPPVAVPVQPALPPSAETARALNAG